MENASQALIIAAGILIGVIILSMAVYLFNVFGGYAENVQSKIDENAVTQFNNKFLKYAGLKDLTIQDVITVKNYALETNEEYGNYNPLSNECRAGENNEYIDVYYARTKTLAHLESALILTADDEELLKEEMQKISNDGKKYNRFTCEVEINSKTGKVNKVYFYETK